jgi:hypothetical protein
MCISGCEKSNDRREMSVNSVHMARQASSLRGLNYLRQPSSITNGFTDKITEDYFNYRVCTPSASGFQGFYRVLQDVVRDLGTGINEDEVQG